jgi:O-antigen ligase
LASGTAGKMISAVVRKGLIAAIIMILWLIPLAWSRQVNANYFTTKLFLFYAVSGLALAFMAIFQSKINFLKVSSTKALWVPILLLLGFNLAQPLAFANWGFILFAFKFFALLALILFFVNINIEKFIGSKLSTVMTLTITVTVIAVSLNQFYDFRIERGINESWHILGTFGNINMMAEFLLLSLPLVSLWVRDEKYLPRPLKILIFSLWIFLIVYARSRSGWLSLALWSGFILILSPSKNDIISLLVGVSLYFAANLIPSTQDNVAAAKSNSFAERLSLYKATAELVVDRPLGIGVGTFSNEIIPYRMKQDFPPPEFEFADQPHSEILKWFAQYGWVGGFLCLFLIGFIVRNLWLSKDVLLGGAFVAMVPQLLFQFPFENPATLLLLAFYFAIWIGRKKWTQEVHLRPMARLSMIVVGLIIIVNGFLFFSAVLVESQFKKDLQLSESMCALFPINIRNCNNTTLLYTEQKNLTAARQILKQNRPYAYFASDFQRMFTFLFQFDADKRAMCEMIHVYNTVYKNQRNFPQEIVKACQPVPVPFRYEAPEQFKTSYVEWLDKKLN